MNDLKLIELILPEGILEYFEVVSVEKERDFYIIYLDEKNLPPSQYKDEKLVSKGFYETITIQDFPLRGSLLFEGKTQAMGERKRSYSIQRLGFSGKRNANDKRVCVFYKSNPSIARPLVVRV